MLEGAILSELNDKCDMYMYTCTSVCIYMRMVRCSSIGDIEIYFLVCVVLISVFLTAVITHTLMEWRSPLETRTPLNIRAICCAFNLQYPRGSVLSRVEKEEGDSIQRPLRRAFFQG